MHSGGRAASGLNRLVEPEWLDELAPDDPQARLSRRDLARLDHLLGASDFVVSQVAGRLRAPRTIVELGAGSGGLCRRLAGRVARVKVFGCDLVKRPTGLPESIGWLRGHLMETLPTVEAEAVVGALILHHFQDADLRRLGGYFQKAKLLVFFEPLRSRLPLSLCRLLFPLVSPVTRHDMPASIRAGFREGELIGLLGLGSEWQVEESRGRFGTLRIVAWRR